MSMVVGVLSGYQCSHKSFINQSQLWAFEQGAAGPLLLLPNEYAQSC